MALEELEGDGEHEVISLHCHREAIQLYYMLIFNEYIGSCRAVKHHITTFQ